MPLTCSSKKPGLSGFVNTLIAKPGGGGLVLGQPVSPSKNIAAPAKKDALPIFIISSFSCNKTDHTRRGTKPLGARKSVTSSIFLRRCTVIQFTVRSNSASLSRGLYHRDRHAVSSYPVAADDRFGHSTSGTDGVSRSADAIPDFRRHADLRHPPSDRPSIRTVPLKPWMRRFPPRFFVAS